MRGLLGAVLTALILGACTAAIEAGDASAGTEAGEDETRAGVGGTQRDTGDMAAGSDATADAAGETPPATDGNQPGTVDPPDPVTVKLSSLVVSGGDGAMYPAFAGDILHYALYCSESPTLSVAAETEHDGALLTLLRADSDDNTDSTVSASGALSASVTVDEDHDLAIEVSAGGETATYVVHCLPAAFPAVNVTKTDQVKDGLLLMTPTYGGYHDRITYLAVLDNNGVPRFHRLLTDTNFWAMNLQYHGGGRFSVSRRPLLNVADSAFGNWQIDLLNDRVGGGVDRDHGVAAVANRRTRLSGRRG